MALPWVDFVWTMKRWNSIYPLTSVNGVEISGTNTSSIVVSGESSISGQNTGDQTLESLGALAADGTAYDVSVNGPQISAALRAMSARIDLLERTNRNLGEFLLGQGIEIPEEMMIGE